MEWWIKWMDYTYEIGKVHPGAIAGFILGNIAFASVFFIGMFQIIDVSSKRINYINDAIQKRKKSEAELGRKEALKEVGRYKWKLEYVEEELNKTQKELNEALFRLRKV
jgi:5-bromo-4-chloroindolyl phosphate hydrolysis protein